MSELYQSLAEVYDGMYRTFINYDEEFDFYNQILKARRCKKLLEVGCGTGHLAGRLIEGGYSYTGLDLSAEMLAIARRQCPKGGFEQGDIRTVSLSDKFDSVIITGRTISYLVSNKDVHDSLKNIHQHLVPGGLICFDCIDANKFMPLIKNGEKIKHTASFNGRKYVRESLWSINFSQSWAFDWQSVYYEDRKGEFSKIGEDFSTIRAFSKDEIKLFLKLGGFKMEEIIDRPSYAFDTFVIVARSNAQ